MSRALVRNDEIYREETWSAFTRNHLEWHSTAPPQGDGYALAEDCPEDAIATDFNITQTEVQVEEPGAPDGEEITRTVVTRLTATLNTERYNARKAQEVTE